MSGKDSSRRSFLKAAIALPVLGNWAIPFSLSFGNEIFKKALVGARSLGPETPQSIAINSGFRALDKVVGGFQPGQLIVLGSRPSMGKTALSLNFALNAAREGRRIAYFSVEMAKEQLMARMISAASGIRTGDLRAGNISDADWPRLINASAEIAELPIHINNAAGISPGDVLSEAKLVRNRGGLDLVFVDYLQLMSMRRRSESREREVSEITKALKFVARDLCVPVIVTAQLYRGLECRGDKRPRLTDLRESSSIEQDADLVMLLYRAGCYNRDEIEERGRAEVIVAKNRLGETGTAVLKFDQFSGQFSDIWA
jgi:replicative DNA helicase